MIEAWVFSLILGLMFVIGTISVLTAYAVGGNVALNRHRKSWDCRRYGERLSIEDAKCGCGHNRVFHIEGGCKFADEERTYGDIWPMNRFVKDIPCPCTGYMGPEVIVIPPMTLGPA